MRKYGRRLGGVLTLAGLVMALMVPSALANHPPTTDAGVDITNTGEEMNKESFWEAHFDGEGFSVTCTKFEGHGGSIPANVDAAVIKSGSTLVRVYADLTEVGAFTALGPANPNNQHPDRRFEAPFSWVMKCVFEDDPDGSTTTTIDDSTTTTFDDSTTTTVDDPTTTTVDVDDSTTTTTGETTTTEDQTTTTSPTTTSSSTPEELPFTGVEANPGLMSMISVGLLALGAAVIFASDRLSGGAG